MDVGDVGQSHHMGCSWEFMVDYGDCIFGVVCSWYDLPQGRRLMEGVMTPERIGATPYFGGNDPFRIPLSPMDDPGIRRAGLEPGAKKHPAKTHP